MTVEFRGFAVGKSGAGTTTARTINDIPDERLAALVKVCTVLTSNNLDFYKLFYFHT